MRASPAVSPPLGFLRKSGLRAGPIFSPRAEAKLLLWKIQTLRQDLPPLSPHPSPFPCLGFSFQWLKAHLLHTPHPLTPSPGGIHLGGGDVEGLAVLGNTGHLPRGHPPAQATAAPATPSSFPGCSMRPEGRQPVPPDPVALPQAAHLSTLCAGGQPGMWPAGCLWQAS